MASRHRTGTHALNRQLRAYQRRPGNWRLKGLLYALRDDVDPRAVGHAWPRKQPTRRTDVVYLGARDEDTYEYNVARQLYGKEAIREGEVVARDEYIARALVNETETELDVLWRDEIHESVMAGAATRRIARDATTVTPMSAKKGTVPVHEQIPFADTNAEGASAPEPGVGYTPVDYDCEEFSAQFAMTDELIDEATPDALEAAIRYAGEAVENSINRQHLTNIIDNANQNVASVGNEATVQTILEAMENVTDGDFDPANIAIMHTEFRTELGDDPAVGILDFSRYRAQADRELQEGGAMTQPEISVGPELYVHSGATYNGLTDENLGTANTWGWESGGEIGGVVYGRPFVHTVIYRDIEVSEFTERIEGLHDIQGGVASAWTDSVQASNDAISTITQ